MASDNEESLAQRLRFKFSNDSILALYTPFVVSLAAGNLKPDAFQNFSSQGHYFIKCYAESLEIVEKCIVDDDDKNSVSRFKNLFRYFLGDYDSLVKRWGFDYTKAQKVNPATIKCTVFVYAIAKEKWATSEKTKVGAYTLGAMLPHIQLYAFIAKELQSLLDDNRSSHPYKMWIDYYTSKYYQDYTLQAEDLLEKLCVSLTGEELDTIQKYYEQAMVLELILLYAQPMEQKTVVPLLKEHNPSEHHFMVFSDFDLMCTTINPSAILAKSEAEKEPESDQVQSSNQTALMPSADLMSNTWGLFSREYKEEYEQCTVKLLIAMYEKCMLKTVIADYEQRIQNISLAGEGTIANTEEYERCITNKLFSDGAEKFNYTVLKKAFEQLSEFQKRANTKVIEPDQLKGLNLEENNHAGVRHILQDSCQYLLQSISNMESISASIHVLSYRWSYDVMKSVFSSANLHTLGIHENEVIYEESITTGEILRRVESPIDRVNRFDSIRQKSASGKNKMAVYIGQSIGDLLCLLEADIGIVMDPSESLKRVGSQFGISFVPLFLGLVHKQKELVEEEEEGSSSCNWTGLSGILYTVSSWDEVQFLIEGS